MVRVHRSGARAGIAGRPAAVLLTALALGACTLQSPQVFSRRLLEPRPAAGSEGGGAGAGTPHASGGTVAGGNVRIADAIDEAQRVQRQYVTAVRDLSEAGTVSGAALLGLAALGLYKGITHPNGRDLAGIGIVGGTAYALSTTFPARPRQQIFLAGAEALNCAVTATRPYAVPDAWMGDGADGLLTLARNADTAAAQLDPHIRALESLDRPETREGTTGRAPAADCARRVRRSCEPPASADKDRLELHRQCVARRDREDARCAPPARTALTLRPHPEVRPMLEQLRLQRRHLARLAAQAREQGVAIEGAGNALWQTTIEIQLRVGKEVLKVEPDPAAVLSAAQGLRGTAFALSAAPAFRPAASAPASSASDPAGTAQSGGRTAASTVRDRPDGALNDAAAALDRSTAPADALSARLEAIAQRLRSARVPLSRCGQDIAGAGLSLSPDVSDLQLAPGGSATFAVAGGSGTPQIAVVADGWLPADAVTRNLDGSFTLRVPAGATEGATATLRFSDGSGRLSREVALRIGPGTAAPAAGVNVTQLDMAMIAPLVGVKSQPPNPQEVIARIESCLEKARPGAGKPDLTRLTADQLALVLRGDCRG